MLRTTLLFAVIISACLSINTGIYAKDYIWDGGGDKTTWNDPKNWEGDAGYPSQDDAAIFPEKAEVSVTDGFPVQVKRIEIKKDAVIELEAETSLKVTGGDGVPCLNLNTPCKLIIGDSFTLIVREMPSNLPAGTVINMGVIETSCKM